MFVSCVFLRICTKFWFHIPSAVSLNYILVISKHFGVMNEMSEFFVMRCIKITNKGS